MSKALDDRVDFGMWVKGMAKTFQGILARTLSDEAKLELIIKAMTDDVQEKRVLARQIGSQMRAMADPDTADLEPLEASQARRAKLVKLGGTNLGNDEMLGQIQQEIKGLDALIASQQGTYDTLAQSYALAMTNYKQALAALESARANGPAMLLAIKAHHEALEQRDKVRSQEEVDASFLSDLAGELQGAQAELRSDEAIDADLDATRPGSIDAALAAMDAKTVDESLMAEFEAAAAASGGTKADQPAAPAGTTYTVHVEEAG
jgi:hypothetical protein